MRVMVHTRECRLQYRYSARLSFVPEDNRTVTDRPVFCNSHGNIATGYVCACPRCLQQQRYHTTPLGTFALLRHLLAHVIFPEARFSGVFGDFYCRAKLNRQGRLVPREN